MSNLVMDRDVDVSQQARSVHSDFRQLPIRMAGGAGATKSRLGRKTQNSIGGVAGMLDMNGAAGGLSKFEARDSQKLREEADITINADEAETSGDAIFCVAVSCSY